MSVFRDEGRGTEEEADLRSSTGLEGTAIILKILRIITIGHNKLNDRSERRKPTKTKMTMSTTTKKT